MHGGSNPPHRCRQRSTGSLICSDVWKNWQLLQQKVSPANVKCFPEVCSGSRRPETPFTPPAERSTLHDEPLPGEDERAAPCHSISDSNTHTAPVHQQLLKNMNRIQTPPLHHLTQRRTTWLTVNPSPRRHPTHQGAAADGAPLRRSFCHVLLSKPLEGKLEKSWGRRSLAAKDFNTEESRF